MTEKGILGPAMVERTGLLEAAGVATLLSRVEIVVKKFLKKRRTLE